MAFNAGEIVGKVKADISQFKASFSEVKKTAKTSLDGAAKSVQEFDKRLQTAGLSLSKLGLGFTVVGAAAGVLSKKLASDASDYGEALNKTGLAFGALTDEMVAQSETAAATMGMSKGAYLETTSTLGLMLGSMKLTTQEAKDQASAYATLAADMGSAFNAEPVEVMQAFQSAISGSTEPLRRFGIVITQARLEQTAMNMGLVDGKGELDAYSRSMALHALIAEDTKAVQGDFMNTATGLANAQRILKAETENLRIELGQALLPVFEMLVNTGIKVVAWIKQLSPETKQFAGIMIGLTAIVGTLLGPFLLLLAALPSISAGLTLVGGALAFLSGPIGIAIGLAAALLLAWQTNFLGIRDLTQLVWDDIIAAVQLFKIAWELDMYGIQTITEAVWGAIKVYFEFWWEAIKVLFSLGLKILSGDWRGAWTTMQNIAKTMYDVISLLGKKFFETLKTLFLEGGAIVQGLWAGVMSAIQAKTVAAFDAIKSAVTGAINWMIGKLNSFLGALDGVAGVIGKVIGDKNLSFGKIPYLADGGIVTRPTIAMVGEAGAEAVIPLSKLGQMGGGGVTFARGAFDGAVIASRDSAMELFTDVVRSIRPNLGV
jgi:hypothetical protein